LEKNTNSGVIRKIGQERKLKPTKCYGLLHFFKVPMPLPVQVECAYGCWLKPTPQISSTRGSFIILTPFYIIFFIGLVFALLYFHQTRTSPILPTMPAMFSSV